MSAPWEVWAVGHDGGPCPHIESPQGTIRTGDINQRYIRADIVDVRVREARLAALRDVSEAIRFRAKLLSADTTSLTGFTRYDLQEMANDIDALIAKGEER